MLHIFCDICIKAIDIGMRPNTHFDKTRIWNKLVSETGVGWNSELGTISASDEWWKQKIQEIRGAKKFRHVGIEPSLKNKFDRMYSNIVATRDDVDPGTSNANIDCAGLEEGSGDSKEDVIPDFQTDMSSTVATQKAVAKKKARDPYEVRGRKKKTYGIGVQLLSRCNQLLESMSTKSDSTFVHMDREGYSIREVMAELHSIPGVSIEDEFHDFATEYLSLRRKREMWASMGDKQQKLRWLQRMYACTKRA
ncbi:hypothetical protein POPTR_002G200700v4 [Populus trichocarpa]|uniref:Uncharacterized protein n=1 Tax=Populus trichocarpa TaxID=3694 RepID=A0ACC0TEZ4_POPTR|nr:hypothetical protein POPTR_002G200700v4 [Populus trichocarpa]